MGITICTNNQFFEEGMCWEIYRMVHLISLYHKECGKEGGIDRMMVAN